MIEHKQYDSRYWRIITFLVTAIIMKSERVEIHGFNVKYYAANSAVPPVPIHGSELTKFHPLPSVRSLILIESDCDFIHIYSHLISYRSVLIGYVRAVRDCCCSPDSFLSLISALFLFDQFDEIFTCWVSLFLSHYLNRETFYQKRQFPQPVWMVLFYERLELMLKT